MSEMLKVPFQLNICAMKRDPRLRSLSSDHHRALVMARKMEKAKNSGDIDPGFLNELLTFCGEELSLHFSKEEEFLLPPLKKHGENEIVERTLREHAQMMELVPLLEQKEALTQFAQLLKQHVRFEEQRLFEISQGKLSDTELEIIAAAS